MRTTKMLATVAAFALAGCHMGSSGANLPVANQPGGASVSLRTSSGAYSGELLAVQDDGVIISGDRIMFASFSSIVGLTVEKMGGQYRLGTADVPRGETLARFRAVSRFPQGMTPSIRAVLLAQKSQTEIAVIP
ncbi:MAG TPA: hypothetical protein VF836_05755 [Gemmatimonadaceae bacterium]